MYVENNLDFLRDVESSRGRQSAGLQGKFDTSRTVAAVDDDSDSSADEKNIPSDVDFLRAMEGDDTKKERRRSSSNRGHQKRSSLSSITSNTKNKLAGKFGDAFRRFESNQPTENQRESTPPPGPARATLALTPIAGSEATEERSDDEAITETQELAPEVRREMERRRLSQEEKRVEAAAAEYRKRLAEQGGRGGGAPSTRATSIQNRVKELLDDSKSSAPTKRTAEGYGRFTETARPAETQPSPADQAQIKRPATVSVAPANATGLGYSKPRAATPVNPPQVLQSTSVPPQRGVSAPRPSAPPKPKALRTGIQSESQPPMVPLVKPSSLTGRPLQSQARLERAELTNAPNDDWESSFTKRYPSLSGLEMVEADIGKSPPPTAAAQSVRDV